MNEKPLRLPKHTFARPTQLTSDQKNRLERELNTSVLEKPVPTEAASPELMQDVESLAQNQALWIYDQLTLNVLERFPSMKKTFYFTETNMAIYRALLGKKGAEAFHVAALNEFNVEINDNPRQTMHNLAHEFIHGFSTVKLRAVSLGGQHNGKPELRTSYTYGFEVLKTNQFELFNEAITEMLNIEILDHVRKQHNTDYLTGTGTGYYPMVFLIDEIVNKAAERIGRSAKELRHDFYRAYIMGNHGVLRLLTRAFGVQAVAELGKLKKNNGDWPSIKRVGQLFKLDTYALSGKIATYLQKQDSVTIMDGILLG